MLTAHCHMTDPRLRGNISRYVIFEGGIARHHVFNLNTLYIHLPETELIVGGRAITSDVLHVVPDSATAWEKRRGRMLVVNFFPGGVTRLFGLDASRMAGTVGPDDPLPHPGLTAAADAARSSDGSPEGLVAALDEAFLRQWPDREPEGLAERVYQAIIESESTGAFQLSRLAASLNVSQRTLQRVFKRRYGVTMARYLRVHRLWAALQVSSDKPSVWKHLPPNYGFVDQSHFLRDAREVAGATPDALRSMFNFRMRFYPRGSFRREEAREIPSQLPEWRKHYLSYPGSRHWLPETFHES